MDSPHTDDASEALRRYLRILRAQWAVIATAILVGAGGALVFVLTRERVYEAESQLQFKAESSDLTVVGIPAVPSLQPQKEIAARAEAVEGEEVIGSSAATLRRRMTAGELRDSLQTAIDPVSDLVTITVETDDAQLSADAANAVARQTIQLETRRERQRYAETADRLQQRVRRLGEGRRDQAARATYDEQISRLLALSTFAEPWKLAAAAEKPGSPASPKPVRDTAIGGVLGLILGLAAALLRNSFDRRLRSSDDFQERLNLPVIGAVGEEAMGFVAGVRNGDRGADVTDLEPFWLLRANLEFLAGTNRRIVAVSSGVPEEGKSTVAASLAMANAAAGKSTLLVETDFRRPVLAQRLGVPGTPGLTDYLRGADRASDALRLVTTEVVGESRVNGSSGDGGEVHLSCIFAGGGTPNPPQLLGSPQFVGFLKEASRAYELVVLDTCPLLPVADARKVLPHADVAIICVRAHKTTSNETDAVRAALDLLPDKTMGIVVTGIRQTGDEPYYPGGYGYSQAYADPTRA